MKIMQTTEETLSQESVHAKIFSANGMQEKRDILKSLSKTAKLLIELCATEHTRVNDVILYEMYSEQHSEFHTFKDWKEMGFNVIKGSKAFFIWSKPKKAKKKSENEDEENDKEFKMYGIAHLFSNSQVEPMANNT